MKTYKPVSIDLDKQVYELVWETIQQQKRGEPKNYNFGWDPATNRYILNIFYQEDRDEQDRIDTEYKNIFNAIGEYNKRKQT